MASFTDLIPQFNPYIQQLPVEAMVSVGMEKQKRYDEGIQKLQSQVDQVAGLNVLRPQDKAYLQSKINELGNNLKGVAAGDFSNMQLVNSVGGMIGQISKDPFVIAAVKSTNNDQKNLEQIDTDRRAGKLAPENEVFYSKQRKKYLEEGLKTEDGKPVIFNGYYLPFKDVYTKLRTIAKDVGVDENIVQNLFNPDGSVNKVMIETVSKGKDANKIYDAFINGLDQSDYQQLAITGMYKYRGSSPEDVVSILDNSNRQYIATAQSKKADLETTMADLKQKLVSAKPAEATIIEQQILRISSTIKKIDDNVLSSETEFSSATDKILSGDEDYLDQIKGKIHTNNFLTSLSKDFAESVSHVKYSENPLWKAIMEENKFALDKWYKEENLKIEKRKAAAAEKANKLTEQQLFPVTKVTGALEGDEINFPDLINEQYISTLSDRNQKVSDLARWDMKRLGWSDEKMLSWIKTQAKARNQSEEEVLLTWGTNTLSKIKSGSVKAPSELASEVGNIEDLNNFVSGFSSLIKRADEKAKQQGGENVVNVADIMKSAKPVTYNVLGKDITLSPADQVDLAKYVSYRREIFSTKAEDAERLAAIQRLENKFGKSAATTLLNYGESEYAKTPTWGKRFMFGDPFTLVRDLATGKGPGEKTPFQNVLSAYQGSAYNKYKDVQSQVYKEIFSAYFPKNESVMLTEKSRPLFESKFAAMFIDRPEYTEIKSLLDDPKSQIVVSTVPSVTGFSGNNQISLKVAGKDGAVTEPITMSLEQYQVLFDKNPEEVNPVFAFARAITNSSPDGSSNKRGIGSVPTAYFGSNAFKNLTLDYRSRVHGGDFVKDASGSDIYYPKLYYTPQNSRDTLTIDVGLPLSLGEALSFPTMLDDNKLKSIISNR